MENNSLIATVLMSVYNDEVFVEEAIKSVVLQLTEDMEFLIIDDSSSDRTSEIINNFQSQYPKIRIIRNEQNRGLGYCLAIGTEKAKGKYIIRMDADDICLPDRFSKQISFLEKNPDIDIVGGSAIEIDEKGNKGVTRQMPLSHEEISKSIWACPLLHPTVAFKKDKILLAGNYNPQIRRRQDYDLWFRCAKQGLQFTNLSEPLIYYRFTANSHRKQSFKLAFEQAKIGWNGCRMLKSPWWQYLAVMVPILRAIFPPSFSHLIYRSLAPFDPRKNKNNNLKNSIG
jgi:glycosyltransferase involved in cell wall biosynthesis